MAAATEPHSCPQVTVRLLGPFSVERDGAPLDTNHWPRAVQTLFKLLLIAPRHEYRREAAIDLLWPESSPEAGAGSMRHALHVLRQQLGGGDPSLVISQHGWLRLHPDYRWDIDIDRFETLASAAGDDVEEIESALSLYIGEPLVENRYDDWATPPRERAQRTWRDLALRLAGLYRNLGRPQQGLTWCERVVEADPLDEQAVQAMLQILDDLGQRAEAHRFYRRFENRLHDEMGLKPTDSTKRLLNSARESPRNEPSVRLVATTAWSGHRTGDPEAVESPTLSKVEADEESGADTMPRGERRRHTRLRLVGAAAIAAIAVGASWLIFSAVMSGRSVVAHPSNKPGLPAHFVPFVKPMALTIGKAGDIYVSDNRCPISAGVCLPPLSDRLLKLSPSGIVIGSWDKAFQLQGPAGLARDGSGNIYVVETTAHRITKLSPKGKLLAHWGSEGTRPGQLESPIGLAVNRQNDIFVADTGNHRIQELSPSGHVIRIWGSQGHGAGQFEYPSGIAVDTQGNLYVADTINNRVQKFSPTGTFISQWGHTGGGRGSLRGPLGLTVGSNGNVYVADTGNDRVQQFSATGRSLASWGRFGVRPAQFNNPTAVSTDSHGNLFVVDAGNARVQKFSAAGSPLAQWGKRVIVARLCVEVPAGTPGMATMSRAILNGVRLATAQRKARFAGVSLDLSAPRSLAESFDPGHEVRNARACLRRSDTFGYIGPVSSGDALSVEPVLNAGGMATISPANTGPALTDPKQRRQLEPATFRHKLTHLTYYRIVPTERLLGPAAASFMRQRPGVRSYYAVDDGTSYERAIVSDLGATRTWSARLHRVGVGHLVLADPATMYRTSQALADRILAKHPDGVYCACDAGAAAQFAHSLRAKGYYKPIVGSDASFEASGAWTGKRYGEVYATSVGLPRPLNASQAFVIAYRNAFHQGPDPWALPGFKAANIALNGLYAADKAGRFRGTLSHMREAILPYVAHARFSDGQRLTTFDKNGDVADPSVSVYALQHGRWRFFTAVHPASARVR